MEIEFFETNATAFYTTSKSFRARRMMLGCVCIFEKKAGGKNACSIDEECEIMPVLEDDEESGSKFC